MLGYRASRYLNLCLDSFERLRSVGNGLVKLLVLNAEHLSRSAVVNLEHTTLGVVTAGSLLSRQLVSKIGEVLAQRLAKELVVEVARHKEESLAASFRQFSSLDVSQGNITDVDPDVAAGLGDLLLGCALDEVSDTFVRGVQRGKGVEVVDLKDD